MLLSSIGFPILRPSGLAISAVTNGADGLSIQRGAPVTWTYTVRNTGNVGVAGIVVSDNQTGVTPVYASGDLNNNGILDVGETWTYTASGTALGGTYSNVGTVRGSVTDSLGRRADVSAMDPSGYVGSEQGMCCAVFHIGGRAALDLVFAQFSCYPPPSSLYVPPSALAVHLIAVAQIWLLWWCPGSEFQNKRASQFD